MNKFVLFVLVLLSFNLYAVEETKVSFGRIIDLKGEGFISYKGKTRELKKGETLEIGAEIVIEHSGQVTFTDNADHRFYLGNSSSARVYGGSVELREGDIWFQSLNKNDDFKILSANAAVTYQGGEAIISYDSLKGKTQLMVINGIMTLANLRATELNLKVSEGHFSFIENAYEDGAPRDPTPVGERTYGRLISLFKGVSPLDKNSLAIFKANDKLETHPTASREVASVHDKVVPKESKMLDEYKSSLLDKKKLLKTVTTKTNKKKGKGDPDKFIVHIYGLKGLPTSEKVLTPEVKTRAPASVVEHEMPAEMVIPLVNPYNKDYKDSTKESDKLIDDLKKL